MIAVWRSTVVTGAMLAIHLFGVCTRCLSAQADNVPADAKGLVVKVVSYFQEGRAPTFGAGILLGGSNNSLYIATAGHVIQRDTAATTIWVVFASRDSVLATVSHPPRPGLDFAVLTVVIAPLAAARVMPHSWDRRGDVHALKNDDPVSPVGCPQGSCWQAPAPPDRIIAMDRLGILFQSSFVDRGSSGGALFNGSWEVVGMVTQDAPPRANAISIDDVLREARGFEIRLRPPSVPRAGYRNSVALSWLAPVSATRDPYAEDRLPSGRLVMTRQGQSRLTWHVGLLRLAPDNLSVRAGLVGGALTFRSGRFAAAGFLEAGLGRVEGRFDAGGYYIATGNPQNPNRYVPYWHQMREDGIGIGGGVTFSAIVARHVILDVMTGHWSFTVPDSVPKLPTAFVGAGLRWGL
ncbi:MAG: hypothetical protein DMD40_03680 [Gemmatimonadetes bacterium]|nr:MAG: hypothetical protein DMD40_03680 [Gemmatimonadota bacterium]